MTIPAFQLAGEILSPLPNQAASMDELTRDLPRGLYSTFITTHNKMRVLGLAAHLDRLYRPAEQLGLRPSASRADLRQALASLASSTPGAETRLRVILSETDGALFMMAQPFTPLAAEIYEHGVNVVTAEMTRRDPRLKDTGFITASQSARTKVGGDIFEVLLTKDGKVYEGMTSNVYVVVRSGFLVTAQKGILLGVTRRAVLGLARGQGMQIEYRPPRLLEKFTEAFLTSSSRGVVPIVRIDGKPVGQGAPGVWTKKLWSAYQAYVEARSEILIPG